MFKAEKKYFEKYVKLYNHIPKNLIVDISEINSDKTLKIIKKNKIDILCFLGGEIVDKKIINSVDVCLNYHSGISPFYNGNKSILFSFGDSRPNFAGGTLMLMNERVDGGKILYHYLTPIEDKDNYSDLFMKGIIGCEKVYSLILNKINKNQKIKGITQKRTFRYTTNIDWIITNDIKLLSFMKSGKIKNYIRKEYIFDYSKEDQMNIIFNNTLNSILKSN